MSVGGIVIKAIVFSKERSGAITLHLIDRGPFHKMIAGEHYDDNKTKGPCIINISVPPDKLEKVLKNIKEADFSDGNKAGILLRYVIETLTQNKYQVDVNSVP
jgi:hypothetical protein